MKHHAASDPERQDSADRQQPSNSSFSFPGSKGFPFCRISRMRRSAANRRRKNKSCRRRAIIFCNSCSMEKIPTLIHFTNGPSCPAYEYGFSFTVGNPNLTEMSFSASRNRSRRKFCPSGFLYPASLDIASPSGSGIPSEPHGKPMSFVLTCDTLATYRSFRRDQIPPSDPLPAGAWSVGFSNLFIQLFCVKSRMRAR